MQRFIRIVWKITKWLTYISKVVLVFMILLTVADVILRSFRRPIIGTYDLVSLSGVVIMGFALPFASWMKTHIYIDFLIIKLPQTGRKIFNIVTRCLGIGLFLVMGPSLIILGTQLQKAGEVTMSIQIPFFPLVYALGICCFVICLVLVCDIVKIEGGKYE